MVGTLNRQSTLFYVAFGEQAVLIKDDKLDALDALLDDEELVELVRARLASRHKLSGKAGRTGIAPDRLLRCCALKHIKNWSFRGLETEVRGSLVYRRFTRYNEDAIPDYSSFSRLFALLGRATTKAIHQRIVAKAKEAKVAPGRKLRTDTTVVETNIHHPTDSSLLGDGIRVLTRGLKSIADECDAGVLKVVDHARAVKYRLLEIWRAAKVRTEAGKERLKTGYTKLLELSAGVIQQATSVVDRLAGRGREKLRVTGKLLKVLAAQATLERFVPLVQRVVAQTKERVFEGNTRVVNKLLSLFETSTAVIKKGKEHKPAEFGRKVRIDEVENGIVSNYEVQAGNPADTDAWKPAISQHVAQFGSAPRSAAGDRGFFSAANEKLARDAGVKNIALPARGPLSAFRKKLQKQRWFRRLLRWRTGIESRIATLKHVFEMDRAVYKGDEGMERHVGWSVIANNLVSLARTLTRRKEKQRAKNEV
jgi:IS5 family transposase